MAIVDKKGGKLPAYMGDWSATYNDGHGYMVKNRVTIFGSEVESLIDNNTYVPATRNEQTGVVTFEEHWKVISNGSQAYAAALAATNKMAELEEEWDDQDQRMTQMQATINAKQLEVGAVQTDEVPTENSGNHMTSGDIYQTLKNSTKGFVDDEPTAGSDNLVKSGGVQNELALGAVYDVSAKNPTAGPNNDGKFESLSALLSDASLNALIPTAVRRGGMSIKFVQSSDNKYVQARLMSYSFTTDVTQWQRVIDEVSEGSKDVVTSGAVAEAVFPKPSVSDFSISDENGNNVVDFKNGHIKTKNFDSETTIEKLDTIEEGADVNNTETISSVSDFSVADEKGNNVVDFKNGHIKTKHFDSENIVPEPSLSDFAISDKNGNKVLEVDNGDIKTKNFDSTYYGFGKPLHISIVTAGNISSKIHEGEYGFNTTAKKLYTIENGNLKDVTNLLDDKTIYTLPGTNENDLYLWNGYHFVCINDSFRDIIPKIPYMQFEVDTALKNSIHDDYELIDYSSPYTIIEQVYALFDDLVSNYGDYITKVDAAEEVGLSYPSYANLNGQASGDYLATPTYKTYMYKLHDNDVELANNYSWNHKRKMFLIGGLHGNERISPFNLYMLAANLCKRFLDDTNTFKLRGTYDFYIIPCLNGYGMYHGTRANANNVNINRNFPCPWWEIGGQEHMDNPNLSNYTGPAPASEFETKIVIQQCELIKPDIFIDNHNYGEESHIYYCSLMSYKWAPLASPAEIYAAYAFKKAYPQYFGTNFKGLIYDDNATSPKIYYGPGTSLDCMSFIYFDWKYPSKFSCTIEYPPHIKVRDGVWTGVNEVPMYSEDVLRLDEYLLRMHLQLISNVFLRLNS